MTAARRGTTHFSRLGGAVLLVLSAGCDLALPRAWVTSDEAHELPAEGVAEVRVVTHNGDVRIGAAEPGVDTISVRARIRVGASTPAEAEAALSQLEITLTRTDSAETSGGVAQEIGWRWRGTPHSRNWQAQVSFDLAIPGHLLTEAEAHNGRVETVRLSGTNRLTSHNGRVVVRGHNGPELAVETHNGQIGVDTEAEQLTLAVHNGSIRARLLGEGPRQGAISSHNGSVELQLGPQTAALLRCNTQNGRIHNELDLADASFSRDRHELTGSWGSGGGIINLESHNGSIRVVPLEPGEIDSEIPSADPDE